MELTFLLSDVLFQTFPVPDNSSPLASAQGFRSVSDVRVTFLLKFIAINIYFLMG